ncbi:MAG: sugar phosphate nucleotidyltransferase [Planctomycetota bacterium]
MARRKTRKEWVDPSSVTVMVLGGGRGTRLYPLTRDRAKPAVGFGGKYRLVDIVLTNCLRSKLNRIFILTQFNSYSLNRHIWQTYSRFTLAEEGIIDVIAAEQTPDSRDWFQGTADAVRQSLRHVLARNPRHVLVLSADQIYSMDYRELLAWHLDHEAHVTLAALRTPESEVHRLGVVGVDDDMRIVGFAEKPETTEEVADLRVDGHPALEPAAGKPFLGSMGIYLFNTDVLAEALDNDFEDFGHEVIPHTAQRRTMSCFPFDGYWEDVGTIEAFYDANMDWRKASGIAAMFQRGASIITHSRQLPPARIEGTLVDDSIIAGGCHIHAERIARSIIGLRSRVGDATVVEDSILMGNDYDEGPVPFEIGRQCHIRRAIIDKNAVLGDGTVIDPSPDAPDADHDLYSIRSGIVVIPRTAVLPQGTRI